tara:strand:+ start:27425 stop:28291 length:867 start_codon:yes stop_codon:yes gene_type:complete
MNKFYCGKKEWDKIISYSRAAYDTMKSEIGGMALMIKDEDNDWHLKDPVIMKQIVTGGNTHLDKVALSEYYGRTAVKMLKKKNVVYKYLWWHSHHTMAAFWSGTDQDTIDEAEEMCDLSFSLVVNLKEEYKFRIALWKPIKVQEDVELIVETKQKPVSKAILTEVDALCEEETKTYSYGGWNGKQSTLWGPNRKLAVSKKTTVDPDVVDVALDEVEKWIKKSCDGTMKYEEFDKNLSELADKVIEAGESITIKRISRDQFEGGKLLGITAYDLIIDEDMMLYNWGYNV